MFIVYRVVEDNKRYKFAVNLVDEQESDIRTPLNIGLNDKSPKEIGSVPVTMQFNIWAIVVLCTAAVLMLEWYIWLRQK